MLRKLLFVMIALLSANLLIAQSGKLKGTVTDPASGETIPFANISLEQGGSIVTGGMTDFDGNYIINPVPAGKYTVKCSYVGYSTKQVDGVSVSNDKITFLNFQMSAGVVIQAVEIYAKPLIDPDQVSTGGSVSEEEIARMPGRSAEAVAATVAGVYTDEGGNVGSIRGAREESTVYYIDGVKVRGSNSLPKSSISEVSVITGGVPAKFGDATGGIISISTKGPSKEFYGGAEVVTSQYLDPYGFNLVEVVASGPMIKRTVVDPYDSTKTKTDVLAGYFLSANFQYNKDYDPSAVPVWKVDDDALADITATPYRNEGYGNVSTLNAEYLGKENFSEIKAHQNAARKRVNVAGRFDVKPTTYVSLAFGGSFDYLNAHLYNRGNELFNTENNGLDVYTNWRVYGRITQRFPDKSGTDEESSSTIKNAYYRIQIDYSKTNETREDDTHKDDLFKYGYVGKFKTYKTNAYSWTDTLAGYPNGTFVHDSFRDTLVTFTPSDINATMSNYTSQIYSYADLSNELYDNYDIIQTAGALLNGDAVDAVYSTASDDVTDWQSPGTQYPWYSIVDNSQFRISASGSADIKDHEVSFGFEFEQRSDRAYQIQPRSLWTLARQLTNNHILELDIDNPQPVITNNVFQDTIEYDRIYSAEDQALFDRKLREHLGKPIDGTEWLDIDSYDPEELSIDYFSAQELLDYKANNGLYYYGYDHKGNRLKNNPSFEDFFNDVDDYGNNTFLVAPYRPTYTAAYVQDKFGFKDLVFNVGLRIDRFDANQMVLKDPFVFRETYKAGDKQTLNLLSGTLPDGIGSDYVVYVNDRKKPTAVKGYRNGQDWYDANGSPIDDPTLIETSNGIAPYLVDPNADLTEKAFKDYDPQIIVMPRISFSFPISDEALFFAHYDVLSTRPAAGYSRSNPIDYQYINDDKSELSNPDLKPEKTIDYEIGFQQKLNDNSSLKLSAFYRDMRDMIQIVNMVGAYPQTYTTYSNLDFGTVKGFSASYDLRRSMNSTIRASYTLQFAKGTGSDANTSLNLINTGQPNLRTTIPLDFDQRHNISLAYDFRMGGNVSGKKYTGPVWFGVDVLANMGANFSINVGSGTPYSKYDITNDQLTGSINGSRLPWRYKIDMRIDRDVLIKWGKKDEEGNKSRESVLNIYLDILNLLNTLNIYAVHKYTGNADDDGYLWAANKQSLIEAQNDEAAYRNYYTMAMNSPARYGAPRFIRLGLQISF